MPKRYVATALGRSWPSIPASAMRHIDTARHERAPDDLPFQFAANECGVEERRRRRRCAVDPLVPDVVVAVAVVVPAARSAAAAETAARNRTGTDRVRR